MKRLYFDYNATTPIAHAVRDAMLPFLSEHFGNPSSGHAMGRAVREAIEDAREQVASLIGAEREEIIFTSGGTEANNLALKGILLRQAIELGAHIVISALEHPAIVQPARFLERLGYALTVVPAEQSGVVSPDAVAAALRPNTILVSIMHANNEIGTIQPLREVAAICRSRGILVHTDAAQTVGKIRTKVDDLGVDLLSIAGHKMYAPKGVGALYVRRGTSLEPLLHGAGHEGGLRAGTENVPYIIGLGKASWMANKALTETSSRLGTLRDQLLAELRQAIPDLTVNGEAVTRLPNTLSVNFPRVSGAQLLTRIPELCASTGAACHSGSGQLSATLEAIGHTPQSARGTVRLSLGWHSTEDEVQQAASLLLDAWERLSNE
jgi:cysteine desulfurase